MALYLSQNWFEPFLNYYCYLVYGFVKNLNLNFTSDDFDLIRRQGQITDARTNRKEDHLERLLYRPELSVQKQSYNPIFKDDFGTRSSSGVSTEPSEVRGQTQVNLGTNLVDNQPIYHSIVPPAPNSAPPPPPSQNYNFNSNYPTYAYPNPYQPR